MSNESSASETTPLRRPESQYSEKNLTVAAHSDIDSFVTKQRIPFNTPAINLTSNNYNNNYTNSGSSGHNSALENTPPQRVGAPVTAATTKSSIRNYTPQTSNNNKIIEVHLSPNNYRKNNNNCKRAMDTNKRILFRVGLDILILICVGIPILGFFLWGSAYERGFFCDDESLKHPFKNSTVANWMLYIIGLVIPVGAIFTVEIMLYNQKVAASSDSLTTRRYVFMGFHLPDWLVECYKNIGVFGFGAAVGQLTTDIAKYSIGRLRPHFFTVCQPVMPDGSTCDDAINIGKYIEDFSCRGVGSSTRMLKEMRLSFPSGHSSFTFYTMVYLALYLQARMKWRGSRLLRHLLQFIFIMIAWYTALSRVSDYKHHWSDVLAGSIIGSVVALIVANFVSDLFDKKSGKTFTLPRTTQDLHSQTLTTTTNEY